MSVYDSFKAYSKQQPRQIVGLLVIIVLSVLSALIPPLMLRYMIDDIVGNNQVSLITTVALSYVAIYILIGLLDFSKQVLLSIISLGFCKQLRITIIKQIHQLPYEQYISNDSGIYEAYCNQDVDAIGTLISGGVISMTIDLMKIIGIIITLFSFATIFGVIALILVPLIGLLANFFRQRMRQEQLKNAAYYASINNEVLETVENIDTIKAYRSDQFVSHKYKALLNHYFQTTRNANFYDSLFSPLMQVLRILAVIIMILLTSQYQNILGVSIGTLVGAIEVIISLFTPVENLGEELQTIQKSFASMERINQFLSLPQEPLRNVRLQDSNEYNLVFKDVSYSYDGIHPVIKHFNLTLTTKDKVLIQGPSGVGKTTLFMLAYGLLKPTEGSVQLNGVDVHRLDDESRRQVFGLVFQKPFFNQQSIYEMLVLNQKDISDTTVWSVLKQVGLDQRVDQLTDIYQASAYSTGEKALFNIARLLLQKPKIIFLDEMSAAIDPQTTQQIVTIINQYAQDKMLFSISHHNNKIMVNQIVDLSKNKRQVA